MRDSSKEEERLIMKSMLPLLRRAARHPHPRCHRRHRVLPRFFAAATTADPPARSTSEILEDIDEVLETIVRPYAQSDGGDVVFDNFDSAEGTLWVRMEGACENCASSTVTLRFKVLSAMKHYCPEVVAVKRVDLDEDSDSDSDDD
jgi:Fe-S cluster biogenesis protein NfuA